MARPSATDRVGRILAIVPWIAAQGRPTKQEVCERFGMTETELLADLEIVPFVGRYPYTPDNLIEVVIDGDHIQIEYGNFFERPLRLSREEALGLLTAGQAARAVTGHDPDGPLARGLVKVAAVLGIDLDDDLRVVLTGTAPEVQRTIEAAITARRVLRIEYYSHSRDAMTNRAVEPHRLFHTEGAWYLTAHCRSSRAERVFRLDRITEIEPIDEGFEWDEASADDSDRPPGVALPETLPRVTLELTRAGAWVAERYPVEELEELPDGGMRVTLAVTAAPWLARLLLQLGPEGRVVAAPPELEHCGRAAAERLLRRYRSG